MTNEQKVATDIYHHFVHGSSLNPYSTPSAIRDWEHGFNGTLPLIQPEHVERNEQYQRGKLCAKVIEAFAE